MQYNDIWILHLDQNGCIEQDCDEINYFVGKRDNLEYSSYFTVVANPVFGWALQIAYAPMFDYSSSVLTVYNIEGERLYESKCDIAFGDQQIPIDSALSQHLIVVLSEKGTVKQAEKVLLMR